jgi:hypothetical protein
LNDLAQSIATLSTSKDAQSAIKSSLVSSINPSSVVGDQIDYIFNNVAPHPGYGSSSIRAELTVIKQRSSSLPVVCGINGANTSTLPVSGSITTFPNPLQVNLECSGTIASAFYQIIEYRWRLNDEAGRPWSKSNDSSFEIVARGSYELAVRYRVSAGAVLLGNDWVLQYTTTDPSLNAWNTVGSTEITIDPQPWNPLIGDPDTLNVASFVTNPGPGKFSTVPGFYASEDDQSPRITLATTSVTETEIRYQVNLDSSLTSESVWFRVSIVPAPGINDHIYVSSFHSRLSEPWIDEVG